MKCLNSFMSATLLSCVLSSSIHGIDTIGGSDYRDLDSILMYTEWRNYIYEEAKTRVDCQKEFAAKAKEYKRIADEKFNEAQRICLVFPYDDQQAALKCFKDAIIMGTTNRDWAGLVRSMIIILADYGLSVYQEWNRMESLLRESEHYYELYKINMDAANLQIESGTLGM